MSVWIGWLLTVGLVWSAVLVVRVLVH
jgi:hypothetical protein